MRHARTSVDNADVAQPNWEVAAPSIANRYDRVVDTDSRKPQIIFRLVRFAKVSEAQPSSASLSLEIRLPGSLTVKGRNESVWLRLNPVSCNDAALSAWGTRDPGQVGISLCQLAKADDNFIEILAVVAMSVAAPRGFVPQQPSSECMTFSPSPKTARFAPGLYRVHVSMQWEKIV